MTFAGRFALALAAGGMCCAPASHSRQDADLQWRPAIDMVIAAFDRHPIVALSEGAGHGQLETLEFFTALVRDPRFPAATRNIVIEFGTARYQAVLDRYVSGEPVARDELRHVWEDTTQVTGVWSLPMYEQMLAEVRSVNARLPAERRVRVLAGDPPIDWSVVTGPADEDMNDWRDAHAAHVVDRHVMRRGERALILIGGAHVGRTVVFPNSLIHLLDAAFPGRTFVIGVLDLSRVDASIRPRLLPAVLPAGSAVRGTWLGKLDVRRIGFTLSTGSVGDELDALLVLSAASPRPQAPAALDPAYARELARRRALGESTQPFRGTRIRFEENRAAFAADADGALRAVLDELLRDRGLRLAVKAFADGSETSAESLSRQRAQLVIQWLAARGVREDRLSPAGCGARRPLTFGRTGAERAMNRRAELVRLAPSAGCDPPW